MKPVQLGDRRKVTRIYVLIRGTAKQPLLDQEQRVLGWTDWAQAAAEAVKSKHIVTNWVFFRTHILPTLTIRPTGLQIHSRLPAKGSPDRIYFAAIDAGDDELHEITTQP